MSSQRYLLMVLALLVTALAHLQSGAMTMSDADTQEATRLMMRFAERTGLVSGQAPQRYLWTDAFAVCNFLGLAQASGEARYRELALRLVGEVHHTLGRHRPDDRRRGWISGMSADEGEAHPTRGGLRIGKPLPERAPNEPLDDRLEWDRDGQYFHYLARWMHALDQVARATGQPRFNRWGRELADTAYRAFTYLPFAVAGPRRMYWKMSIDLSRPLVASMGQQDALDGYITALQLAATAAALHAPDASPDLAEVTRGFAGMLDGAEWVSGDPLGIGGLLTDAYRVQQLLQQGAPVDERLVERLLSDALSGLQSYARNRETDLPAGKRLAFRELGLAIGLRAVERMWRPLEGETGSVAARSPVRNLLQMLMQFAPLGERLIAFWRSPVNQRVDTWRDHLDINEVMLSTSLAPAGFLLVEPPQ